jgi:hypothetical protein
LRYCLTDTITDEQLLSVLPSELELLDGNPAIETSLLIYLRLLLDFFDYYQFLNADADEKGRRLSDCQLSFELPVWRHRT